MKYSGLSFWMGSAQIVQSISSELLGKEGSLPKEEEIEVSDDVIEEAVNIPVEVKLGCWCCAFLDSRLLAYISERPFPI